MDFPPACAGRFNFVPIPHAFSQHSKTLPGKPQIFSVLESNQKLVSEEKGPVQGFQDPPVLQMPELQKHAARPAWKRENSDYLPGLPYRIY